jgi:hypothetical protein
MAIPTDWQVETGTMAQARQTAAAYGIPVCSQWRRRQLLDAVKAGLAPLRAQAQQQAAPEPELTPRTPQEAQAAQGLAALQEARTMRKARPALPGEALPPEPPVWGVHGPQLPIFSPAARPAWMLAPWAGRPPVTVKAWPLYPQI